MSKPCPMNPKQDVTAGPPVRVTHRDSGSQEAYCCALVWGRQRGKRKYGGDSEIHYVHVYVFLYM